MCEYFRAVAFNCQVVPLVIPVRFERSVRSVSVHEGIGRIYWSCPGIQLFISQWLYQRPSGTWGVTAEDFQRSADQAGCKRVKLNLTHRYKNELHLPITPLLNSPFHFISAVQHVSILCVFVALRQIGSGVMLV